MLENKQRESVIQNLKDAGCSESFVENFLICYDRQENEKQIQLLESWRRDLLHRVHKEEKKISCLDYLIYRIQKAQA
ncbi:MAG: hypothetical protein Q4E89_05295 [Eubacteriales bacterium]|nr:hypothetical protein [Eubacteriales bacterium]